MFSRNCLKFLYPTEQLGFFVFALLAIGGAIFMISFTKVVHMVIARCAYVYKFGGTIYYSGSRVCSFRAGVDLRRCDLDSNDFRHNDDQA